MTISKRGAPESSLDAIVIGAGVSGLYAIHHLRDELGLNVLAFDGAGGVGGTWWYNRSVWPPLSNGGNPRVDTDTVEFMATCVVRYALVVDVRVHADYALATWRRPRAACVFSHRLVWIQ